MKDERSGTKDQRSIQDLDDEKAIELLQQSKLLHEQNEAAKADKRAVGLTYKAQIDACALLKVM